MQYIDSHRMQCQGYFWSYFGCFLIEKVDLETEMLVSSQFIVVFSDGTQARAAREGIMIEIAFGP